jgi:hypothetical protein
MDILATNLLGRALFADAIHGPADSNLARFAFLDPRAREFYPDWDETKLIFVYRGIIQYNNTLL